ncbi:DUF378 domain-containing protein [Patescibacteria group bacterium]|nr:DUF378 domain-containing protein [Patescibacteria group bacterium]MBU1034375.1 DUF378 domain-containing protein [Patescibacteria group bacterium]MBU1630063.1 DUF378 domain-containing protein [Patescibacteria group bacterium]MBU1908073.1 DUF378 domain-containing protein [Patescibacteria group bacterium]
MKTGLLQKVAWILVIVGALNWGLVGAFDLDLVNLIFGLWPTLVRVVYILVGLSALVMLFGGSCKAKGGGEKKM